MVQVHVILQLSSHRNNCGASPGAAQLFIFTKIVTQIHWLYLHCPLKINPCITYVLIYICTMKSVIEISDMN